MSTDVLTGPNPLPHDGATFAELFQSIKRLGRVVVPILVDRQTRQIVDGRQRRAIADELHLPDAAVPTEEIVLPTDDAARVQLLVDLNDCRRQRLTPMQRADVVKRLRAAGLSYRAIEDQAGLPRGTARRAATRSGEAPASPAGTDGFAGTSDRTKITGRDGRQHPATRAKPKADAKPECPKCGKRTRPQNWSWGRLSRHLAKKLDKALEGRFFDPPDLQYARDMRALYAGMVETLDGYIYGLERRNERLRM